MSRTTLYSLITVCIALMVAHEATGKGQITTILMIVMGLVTVTAGCKALMDIKRRRK